MILMCKKHNSFSMHWDLQMPGGLGSCQQRDLGTGAGLPVVYVSLLTQSRPEPLSVDT